MYSKLIQSVSVSVSASVIETELNSKIIQARAIFESNSAKVQAVICLGGEEHDERKNCIRRHDDGSLSWAQDGCIALRALNC